MKLGENPVLFICSTLQCIKPLITMKKLNLILIVLLISTSCSERHKGEKKTGLISNFISITENEDSGVKEILDFYGGQCKYSYGVSVSTTKGKRKYFELIMSKSELLEKYAQFIEMPASNISYLFYKNLKEEKEKYDFIKVVIEFSDGEDIEFEFLRDELEIVSQKLEVLETVSELMKTAQYDRLFELFDEEHTSNISIQNIENASLQLDSLYGKIDVLQFQGFRFLNVGNVDAIGQLKLTSVQKREKQITPLTIVIDPGKAITKRPLISVMF